MKIDCHILQKTYTNLSRQESMTNLIKQNTSNLRTVCYIWSIYIPSYCWKTNNLLIYNVQTKAKTKLVLLTKYPWPVRAQMNINTIRIERWAQRMNFVNLENYKFLHKSVIHVTTRTITWLLEDILFIWSERGPTNDAMSWDTNKQYVSQSHVFIIIITILNKILETFKIAEKTSTIKHGQPSFIA